MQQITGMFTFGFPINHMKAIIDFGQSQYSVNFSEPLDISIPLRATTDNVTAWHVKPPRIEPVVMGDWVGDVNKGAAVNFRDVYVNPHGHGTHTECVGHISKEPYTLNGNMKKFMFFAEVVTVDPEYNGDDRVIKTHQLTSAVKHNGVDALIIRTLPNKIEKTSRHYTGTNPPYLDHVAAAWIVGRGIKHLLIDLPSVDKEHDDGKLLSHHIFWEYPGTTRLDCSISELIYVDDSIKDGLYLLNIQITALENDASPSKPVLYALTLI